MASRLSLGVVASGVELPDELGVASVPSVGRLLDNIPVVVRCNFGAEGVSYEF